MPAVIDRISRAFRAKVDLFPMILADVADPEIAGFAIEAPAPWIAETPEIDLVARVRRADKWIVGRNRILGRSAGRGAAHFLVRGLAARVDVDAQHLAAKEILRRCGRVVAGRRVGVVRFFREALGEPVRAAFLAAVADREIEIAVRTEMD